MVNDTEGNGAGSAILIANDFLSIKIVHPLVLARVATIGEALADLGKNILNALHVQAIGKKGGLGRGIVNEFAGLGANFYYLATFYNNHALAIVNGNSGAVADDIILGASVGAAATAGNTLHALCYQYIRL